MSIVRLPACQSDWERSPSISCKPPPWTLEKSFFSSIVGCESFNPKDGKIHCILFSDEPDALLRASSMISAGKAELAFAKGPKAGLH